MKLLFDFLPVVLFFITFKLYDDPQQGIIAATLVIMLATLAQVMFTWWRYRRVARMHLITLGLIIVLGGITVILKDEIYVKWKPTAVNWLFALIFLVAPWFGKKTLVERMMGANIQLPKALWGRLNLAWIGFFVFLGALNLYVVYHFDTATWVNFKLFGVIGLTLVFVLLQGLFLYRYMNKAAASAEVPPSSGEN